MTTRLDPRLLGSGVSLVLWCVRGHLNLMGRTAKRGLDRRWSAATARCAGKQHERNQDNTKKRIATAGAARCDSARKLPVRKLRKQNASLDQFAVAIDPSPDRMKTSETTQLGMRRMSICYWAVGIWGPRNLGPLFGRADRTWPPTGPGAGPRWDLWRMLSWCRCGVSIIFLDVFGRCSSWPEYDPEFRHRYSNKYCPSLFKRLAQFSGGSVVSSGELPKILKSDFSSFI